MSIRDSLLIQEIKYLKEKGLKKYSMKTTTKRVEVSGPISDKTGLKTNIDLTDKNYVRGLIHQEDTHMNITTDSNLYKAKTIWTEGRNCQFKNDSHFNNPVSIMNKLDKD